MYLYHRITADKVGTAADSNASMGAVDDLFAPLDHASEVAELGRSVCVGEEDVFTAGMAHAVGNGAALAAVLLELDHSEDVFKAAVLCELETHLHGAVPAAIVDHNDFVAGERFRGSVLDAPARRSRALDLTGANGGLGRAAANRLVKVFNGFLEGGQDAFLLVVGGEDGGHTNLGGFDGTDVGNDIFESGVGQVGARLGGMAFGKPSIEPAGEGGGLDSLCRGRPCEVGLLGWERGSRFRRDSMEEDEELCWYSRSANRTLERRPSDASDDASAGMAGWWC